MVKETYLVRHPETEAKGRYIGITDADLSEKGRGQTDDIIKYFEKIYPDAVISSPLKRCVLPAKRLAGIKGVPLVIDKRLCEINFGLWEGLNYKEIAERYPGEWAEYMARPLDFTFPEGDNVSEYIRGCIETYKEYIEGKEETLVFITHAGYIRSIISGLLLDDNERFFEVECEYASGYLIKKEGFAKIMSNK